MAYDPNDPNDKRIVQELIDAALEEARTAHEDEIAGLKTKNTDLLAKLRKARQGGEGSDTGEIDRLERELETTQAELRTVNSKLREVNRTIKNVERERDEARQTLQTESSFSRKVLVENALTTELVNAKVAPQFMEAAKALLGRDATVKVDGDNRSVVIGDKSLGDAVKEWASSEAGKHMIAAPNNQGGGANNNPQGGGSKKLSEMSEAERLEMARTNPTGWEQLLKSEGVQLAA